MRIAANTITHLHKQCAQFDPFSLLSNDMYIRLLDKCSLLLFGVGNLFLFFILYTSSFKHIHLSYWNACCTVDTVLCVPYIIDERGIHAVMVRQRPLNAMRALPMGGLWVASVLRQLLASLTIKASAGRRRFRLATVTKTPRRCGHKIDYVLSILVVCLRRA